MTNSNILKLFAGAGILAGLASCSNDEPINGGGAAEGGRTAFMTVNLRDVGAMATRAASDEFGENDGTFDDGVLDVECNINDARFFFFDESGVFVSEASVWNGGDKKDPANDNISYEGNTVIVLKNLSDNSAPKYMLTVLNGAGFTPLSTLKATAESLELGWKNSGNFAMTTTSYLGENNNHPAYSEDEPYYYANVIESDNFVEGNPDDDEVPNLEGLKPVQVYVERLAAKVELDFTDLGNTTVTTDDERVLVKLDATVAGDPNNVGDNQGVTDLYFEILGWDLNGTSKQSYFSKQFNPDWTATGTTPWENWNVAQFRRSYWGKSTTYGQSGVNGINYVTFLTNEEDSEPMYVSLDNIIDPASMGNNIDPAWYNMSGYRYCNERTNTPDIIFEDGKVKPAEVTSVILKGRICDVNGNPLDLVRATNGVLYTKDQYLQYILNNANVQKGLNIWYVVDTSSSEYVKENGDIVHTDGKTYRQVGKDMVTLKKSGLGTGRVKVVPNLDSNITYYKRNSDGEFKEYATVEAENGEEETDATAALEAALDITLNNGRAEAYTGGCSYYNIPIEHEKTVATAEGDNKNIVHEGYYGVVRNHWYKLSVKKIEKVGHGVFEPGTDKDNSEEIIPNEPEDPAYYVTAVLRVLSWKRVNQEVNL